MKLIELNKRFYEIPTAWDELTEPQLLQVMDVLFLKDYKAEQMLLRLVQVLTGMKNYQFFRCPPEEVEEFFYLLVFLLRADIDFTRNLLPVVACKQTGLTFYGPADRGDNLRMAEFSFSEDLFIAWSEDKENPQLLNELVATLYRPAKEAYDLDKNVEGDVRQKYNQYLCQYYARTAIAHWPLNVRLAIATWYGGVRQAIIGAHPDVFEGGGGEPAQFGLVSVMLDVASDGVFGQFAQVEEEYVNTVMLYLTKTILDAKKLKSNVSA